MNEINNVSVNNQVIVPNSILFNKSNYGHFKGGSPLRGVTINYKNIELLRKFISKGGRILSRRLTGLSAKEQRSLCQAVKIARILALLPFVQL